MADRVAVRSLSQVPDHVLIADLKQLLAEGRANLCDVLLHLGVIDARRLHLPAAYPSLFEYCVRELHFSEGEAFRRIRAARVVRRYPFALAMLADGRLHLTALVVLAPHLRSDNARGLFEAARHRNKAEIELLLAQRFPKPDVPTSLVPVPIAPSLQTAELESAPLTPASVDFIGVSTHSGPSAPRAVVKPLAPERFALHCTLHEQEMADLRRAQELLGRAEPSGDAARVIGRALRLLVEQLEKPLRRSPEATEAPPATDARHVPAETRRQVWQRDGGQCTFKNDSGRRCGSRRDLELDHIQPFARGGRTSVDNLRLRCRAHNQYEADRAYGEEFMAVKRAGSRASASRLLNQDRPASTPARPHVDELIPWLLNLRFRKEEAWRLAELCTDMPQATLEDRLRVALRGHGRMKFGRRTTPEPIACS